MIPVSDMNPSPYYKKTDCEPPIVLHIRDVELETVRSKDGEDEVTVMYFSDPGSKALVLNKTNKAICVALLGGNSATWVGKAVELWNDPSVMYGGNSGGIRLRPPSSPVPAPSATNGMPSCDGVPFSVVQLKVFIEGHYSDPEGQAKVAAWCKKFGVSKVDDMPEDVAAALVRKIREKLISAPVPEVEI
jgi:hypothetical protein